MFSIDKAIVLDTVDTPPVELLLEQFLPFLLDANNYCAGMVCTCDEETKQVFLLSSINIPPSPFRGAKRESLDSFVRECFERFPAPHTHSASRSFWGGISSLADTSRWNRKVLFIPFFVRERVFVSLCFGLATCEMRVNQVFIEQVSPLLDLTDFFLKSQELNKQTRVLELYVKEVGHDIASSVQAIISKLRNVSRGIIEGPAAIQKIREAEKEIMASYRIADTLGITVDPNYNLSNGEFFNVITAAKEVIERCKSEAAERHIEIRFKVFATLLELWGDRRAIQSALTQLLMNAIKYARGSTYISVGIHELNGEIEFSVTDFGTPLDEEEKLYMWDFGFRGNRALELHVNGSGIGLYTVKKVALAHHGAFGSQSGGGGGKVVTFFFKIPKAHILRKKVILE